MNLRINSFLLSALLLSALNTKAQQKGGMTLEQLQTLAKDNYPLLKQKDLYQSIGDQKAAELSTNFLPEVKVVGQATYQSEVTKFAIPTPGGSGFEQKPDQYAFGLELRENLLDYGAIKTQKQIERSNAAIQNQQVDMDFQKFRDRINQLYGNICLQRENKKIMNLRLAELDSKRNKMRSTVENGAALQSNFLVLESEYLSTQQKIEEINSNLVSWFNTLSLFTNTAMDTTTALAEPEIQLPLQSTNIRPELKLFDLQKSTLELRESMITRNNLPKLFLFGRGYYGRPGYNFLNNDFRPYGMVGAGLSWTLSSYYTSGKDKKILRMNSDLVDNQKKIFDLNLQATLAQQKEEISKLEKMLFMDEKIVEAKTAIRKSASSQLDNGVITSADYLVELNAENQAQYNRKLHEIQLLMAKQNYNNSLGY